MTGQLELIPTTIASAFVVGMVLALLGSIKLPLAKRLAIDETRIGGLVSALFFAIIPLMLLSGILIDRFGVKTVLVGGSLLTAIGLTMLALSRSYLNALGSVLLLGAAGACLSNGGTFLMPKAFFPENEAASLNLGNVFFGLGALVMPALAELLIGKIGFRWTLGLVAMLCLAPAVTASWTDQFPLAPPSGGDLTKVIEDPIIWLAALAFLLYFPLEGVVGTWATTYLTNLGYSERRAAWLLSAFWMSFLASRLLCAFLQQHNTLPPWSNVWVLVGLAVFAAIALGNLAGTSRRESAARGLMFVGAAFGPIFPTLVGIVFHRFPDDRGTAYGAVFAIGATGSMIVPPAIGAFARRHSVQRALGVTTIIALLLAAVALVLGLWMSLR